MNLSQEKALYHLTGDLHPNEQSLITIQSMVDHHPYFAPAQSLLAYLYKKEEHPMVVLQTLKTALYFANPYWLQFQIQDHCEGEIKINPILPASIPLFPSGNDNEEMKVTADVEEPFSEPLFTIVREEEPPVLEPVPVIDIKTETPHEAIKEDIPVNSTVPEWVIGNSLFSQIDIPTVEAVKEILRKIDGGDITEGFETEPVEQATTPAETDPHTELAESVFEPPIDNKIASLLSDQLSDFKKPVDPNAKLDFDTNNELLFTVDYFASQGIKIDLTAISQDKLTVHLLKFTDWLRQVKQGELNPKDLLANSQMEQIVVMNAQISNEKGEIITEAMAEVLVKQGQIAHAIILYQKLSFLNPEKSSYFAAKIEQLKGI